MIRKQILRLHEPSRESLLKNVTSKSNGQRLTFNITYYPVLQIVISILQELHIRLTPDQEQERFPGHLRCRVP